MKKLEKAFEFFAKNNYPNKAPENQEEEYIESLNTIFITAHLFYEHSDILMPQLKEYYDLNTHVDERKRKIYTLYKELLWNQHK